MKTMIQRFRRDSVLNKQTHFIILVRLGIFHYKHKVWKQVAAPDIIPTFDLLIVSCFLVPIELMSPNIHPSFHLRHETFTILSLKETIDSVHSSSQ